MLSLALFVLLVLSVFGQYSHPTCSYGYEYPVGNRWFGRVFFILVSVSSHPYHCSYMDSVHSGGPGRRTILQGSRRGVDEVNVHVLVEAAGFFQAKEQWFVFLFIGLLGIARIGLDRGRG